MRDRLGKIAERYEELTEMLSVPETLTDTKRYSSLLKEQAKIAPLAEVYHNLRRCREELDDSLQLAENKNEEEEIRLLAHEEAQNLKKNIEKLEEEGQLLLLPNDPDEDKNIIVEIRAGTGGDEASLFVADLARLYRKYAENNSWKTELLSSHQTDMGGFKEIFISFAGDGVHKKMKYEAGTHRVQRIPATETQGRIHTSAVTVAVLPEVEDVEVEINMSDLRIDTYRSQGAGGQHVNTTDSAVRITHFPSGVVVTCQEERSQTKNKAKAMKYLRSKIYDLTRRNSAQSEAKLRKNMVGSGDRSERIRTYNYPQGRISDHRIKMTLYRLEEIMDTGSIGEIIDALASNEQAEKLQAFQSTDLASIS